MGGCDKAAEAPKSASDLSGVTLILGDQAKGLRTVVEAAHALDGIDYKVQWANFQGAAPLFEALRAGAVDLGPAGDTPVLAAATGGSPLRIVAVRRSQARSIAILVPPDSPIHSVADLKGRNVVVSSARGSISHCCAHSKALANRCKTSRNAWRLSGSVSTSSDAVINVRPVLMPSPLIRLCFART
jgi:sulfonate transport system substrate-binding protein